MAIAVQIATALLLCGPISAAPSCPAQWVQHPGVCLFPRKDQYKNFSVASSPQQEWGSECCSACATDERCASWLLYSEKKGGAPGTSVLCALTRLVWHVRACSGDLHSEHCGRARGCAQRQLHIRRTTGSDLASIASTKTCTQKRQKRAQAQSHAHTLQAS